MRKMKSTRKRKGGANTTRKAIMVGKINFLEAKCKAKYNMKEVDKQLKTIEKKLNEIIYQKEKLELKKQALTECQKDNGIKTESSKSFTRVAVPADKHVQVIPKKDLSQGSSGTAYGFPRDSNTSYSSLSGESL